MLNSGGAKTLEVTLLPMFTRAATNTSATIQNGGFKGGIFMIYVSAVTAAQYINATIQGFDTYNEGNFAYPILQSVNIADTGYTILKIYPGIGTLSNAATPDLLPSRFNVLMTHSGAGDFTYSVTGVLMP